MEPLRIFISHKMPTDTALAQHIGSRMALYGGNQIKVTHAGNFDMAKTGGPVFNRSWMKHTGSFTCTPIKTKTGAFADLNADISVAQWRATIETIDYVLP